MQDDDYYGVLGCGRSASPEEIKKSYKDKARKMHPDKGGDPEQFKKVNEAYRVLGDPELRSRYDQFGKIDGMDLSGHDFPDIFEMFGGGGHFPFGGPSHQQGRKTRDRVMDLEVTMEEAYKGVTVKFRFKRKIFVGDPSNSKCSVCHGQGKIIERMNTNMGMLQNVRMCSACAGMGMQIKENQFKSQAEIVEVIVPPHCHAGYQISIPKKADEMPNMKTGDLVLNVVIKKHAIFIIQQNHHLLWEVEIHPLEALTHFTRTVQLPSGEDISIHHKEGNPFFSLLDKWRMIPQKGLYNSDRERGHVFVSFKLTDFSMPPSQSIPLYEMAQLPLPSSDSSRHHHHSIPLSALDLHTPSHGATAGHPQSKSHAGHPHHHQQPQVQECRPS